MTSHAWAAFLALVVVLLVSAMAGPIDKGAGIDTDKLWQAAHERAVREGK